MKNYNRSEVENRLRLAGMADEQIAQVIAAQEKLEAQRAPAEFGLRLVRPLELARIVVKKIRRAA